MSIFGEFVLNNFKYNKMSKKLNIVIIDAIKSIVEESDLEVNYKIEKSVDNPGKIRKFMEGAENKEVTTVIITLTKNL